MTERRWLDGITDSMDVSLSELREFTETHIHRVSDAIQPPHPLSSPSPPASNPSQHQSLSAINNRIHMSLSILFSSGYMLRSGIAGSYGGFIPSFFLKKSPYHLPQWLY